MEQRRGYLAYLLRLWQVCSEGKTTWRALLESAQTGERVGFASLEELFTFLEKEVCRVAQGHTTPGTGCHQFH
jgi:hypothetical protein